MRPVGQHAAHHHAFDLGLGCRLIEIILFHQLGDDPPRLEQLTLLIESVFRVPLMPPPGFGRQGLAGQPGARAAQPPQPGRTMLGRAHMVEHFASAERQTVAAVPGDAEPGDIALHPAEIGDQHQSGDQRAGATLAAPGQRKREQQAKRKKNCLGQGKRGRGQAGAEPMAARETSRQRGAQEHR